MKIDIVAKVLGFIAYVCALFLTSMYEATMWQAILASSIFGFFIMILASENDK